MDDEKNGLISNIGMDSSWVEKGADIAVRPYFSQQIAKLSSALSCISARVSRKPSGKVMPKWSGR